MTWPVHFIYQVHYQSDRPTVFVTLRRNGDDRRLEFGIDSGCDWTIVPGDLLVPLGFSPPPRAEIDRRAALNQLDEIGCRELGSAAGSSVIGSGFDVTLSVDHGGPQDIDMRIFGDVTGRLSRSLLGRDFFRRVSIVGVDDNNLLVYFDQTPLT